MIQNEINEVIVKVKIEQDDLNKKIYYIYNIDESNINQNTIQSNLLQNIKVTINFNDSVIDNYKKYFIPAKEGLYKITIKFLAVITNCNYLFYKCDKITEIDLSNFNSKNMTKMTSMFNSCKKLNNLIFGNFNTGKVKSMEETFANCENIEKIDISFFKTENVKYMNLMFDNCKKLKEIIFPHELKCENVINLGGMFY